MNPTEEKKRCIDTLKRMLDIRRERLGNLRSESNGSYFRAEIRALLYAIGLGEKDHAESQAQWERQDDREPRRKLERK